MYSLLRSHTMATPDQQLQEAMASLQSGDPSRAQNIAKSVIRTNPRHEGARLMLARAQRSQGLNKQAIQSCRDGLKVLPDSVGLLIEQALALRASGRHADSESTYREVLKRDPGQHLAKHNLANLLQARGALDEAHKLYQDVIAVAPHMAQAHYELGNVLAGKGDSIGARNAWQEALRIHPTLAPAWIKLGHELHNEDLASAIDAFKKGLSIDPNDSKALAVLSTLSTNAGRADEGAQYARMALSISPELALAHYALGAALKASGTLVDALEPLSKAASLSTDRALVREALNMQIACCITSGRLSQADPLLMQLLSSSQQPLEVSHAHHMTAGRHLEAGCAQHAKAHYEKAMAISPDYLGHKLTYCAVSHYCGEFDGAAQKALAIKLLGGIARELPERIEPIHHASPRAKGARIKLGFLSGDFRQHSCAYFLGPLLPNLDKSRFELFAYDTSIQPDGVTRQIMQWIPNWRAVSNLNTPELANTIAQDDLDVLIDLAGLTEGGRLEVLATQPAPVQINWLGFLGTTGHPSIQYRLTDGYVDGPQQEGFATEKPIRLDRPYVCYQPHQGAPLVKPPPMLEAGYPTFGSFNALTKLSNACVALWSKVLKAVPDAKLLLKTKALVDERTCERTLERFAAHGIDPTRIELTGWANNTDGHLGMYHRIDVALDTTPYNGVTTTCEALWMGVPVVNLVGQTYASRQGLSLLNGLGMPDLATSSEEAFVQRCVELVSQPQDLSELRSQLRERMKNGPLTDGPAFTRAFEHAIAQLVEQHEQ
jgi:protein O-GlcNAc transferase